MWIVQLALRRPYTFVVASLLLLFADPFYFAANADRHLSQH